MQNTQFKIGGEDKPRVILPQVNPDGTPRLYPVTIKSMKEKPGRPNDAGQPTTFYSWTFTVCEGEFKDALVFGSTNVEARRSYTTKKPLKFLQLITAVNGGTEPKKGDVYGLNNLIGARVRVELETKDGTDGTEYQMVTRFYPYAAGVAGFGYNTSTTSEVELPEEEAPLEPPF